MQTSALSDFAVFKLLKNGYVKGFFEDSKRMVYGISSNTNKNKYLTTKPL